MITYPIKFTPILQEKIWGGTKLNQMLNKVSDKENIGESWEISAVQNNISVVANGAYKGKTLIELLEQFKDDLVGEKVYNRFGNQFPLLIKFIDAKEDLSIQLHPNDVLADERHDSFGKTEMWYIMQADKDARIIVGFKEDSNQQEFKKQLENKSLLNILNTDKIKHGDVYFIETGTVHAIGAGVLLAEIQQTSDITYRVYDWDRKDAQGNGRELHTELALDAIDFKAKHTYKTYYKAVENKPKKVVACPFFTTNVLEINGKMTTEVKHKDSFVIYMCVKGSVSVSEANKTIETLQVGETILLPAKMNDVEFTGNDSTLLQIYID